MTKSCAAKLTIIKFAVCALGIGAPASAQDIQARAENLLNHARQLSDIRSADAPAFQLRATFSFVGEGLALDSGTYTETWVSKPRWRREIELKGSRLLQIANGDAKFWQLNTGDEIQETASRVLDMLQIFAPSLKKLDFEKVSEPSGQNPPIECAVTRPDASRQFRAFCFDKKTGLLVEKTWPELRPRNLVQYSCRYGAFRSFGKLWYPSEMACFDDRHLKLQAKIIDLSPYSSSDTSLFSPPAGAIEVTPCRVNAVAPEVIFAKQPHSPFGDRFTDSSVTVSLVVGVDGIPTDLKIIHTGGKNFDQQALLAVRDWRFKPAKCGDTPVPAPMKVDVNFTAMGNAP
jgi:TonB family protein